MKKNVITLLVFMMASTLGAWAQQKTIVVEKAGTLAQLLPAGERGTITNLKISGPLNGADILVLRELGKSHLSVLDMAGARIVSGGPSYFPVGSDQDAFTQDDRFSTRFFYGCSSLTSVTLPSSLTSVSNDAFTNCPSLKELKVEDSEYFASVDGILFNATMERVVRCPQGKAIDHYDIPEGVIEVFPGAFRNVKSLKSVTFPASVWSISDFSFYGCPIQTIRCSMPRASIGLAFEPSVMNSARVIVPAGTKSDYMSVEGWNKFKNFVEE